MIKIRKGIFETNSSSTHSIHIDETTQVYETIMPNEKGYVSLTGGEFGWEQEIYDDPLTKANYLYVYAKDWSGDRSSDFLEILYTVIQEHTGCEAVIFEEDGSDYDPYGYIDHQSVDGQEYHYLFEDPSKMKQFIFGKGSYLETDNDNH